MKTIKFIVQVIALCVVLCSFTTTENYPYKNSVAKETIALISTDSVLGVWKYTMTNVDAPYEKGMFFITQKGDSYDVALKLGTGMLTGQDVVVKDNGINFNVNFEGLKRVSFVLVVENDKIVGESYSTIGTSEIFGVRQLPGQ